MLQKSYNWLMKYADHPRAAWMMSFISFIESSVFPLPPDPIYIAIGLKDRSKIFKAAVLCTVSSVLGGYVGYYIGFALFETWGQWILQLYGKQAAFEKTQDFFQNYGFWFILIKGITPIPYKIVTIASGVVKLDLWTFTIASLLARGFRFFYVGVLMWYFGPQMRQILDRYLVPVCILGLTALIFGFYLIECCFSS